MLKSIVDYQNPNSLALRARKKRFDFFLKEIEPLPRPAKILDVGGTQGFWENMNFTHHKNFQIYILNLQHQEMKYPHFTYVNGDATDLQQFDDGFFDLVFSNSVIEHLFTWENQVKMAQEVQRVGKNYFVQTPNYWFPIEPHFVFPFFQYLPKRYQVELVSNFNLGTIQKSNNKERAHKIVEEFKLLTITKMKDLFPDSNLYLEKYLGMTKSIVAYKIN
ncbi:class I SAM-dependent methyltransferase [Flammeovirgaceae bacterium SG7u.111]|nr:class I SAM-dependent methyltransferase [Flammeovirgaceae bacterium SG7u.132]WPO34234.1 class I SAM-dependent methyltransferase [Flammeovirgaceae bacterium SG7u.111]